mmetsp:Transcript_71879/g.83542  ORF Transcript_71879/g.83542 Transcript_71879/m.83542 type:complete len:222 (-) Transcript_71879:1764-2429(-)
MRYSWIPSASSSAVAEGSAVAPCSTATSTAASSRTRLRDVPEDSSTETEEITGITTRVVDTLEAFFRPSRAPANSSTSSASSSCEVLKVSGFFFSSSPSCHSVSSSSSSSFQPLVDTPSATLPSSACEAIEMPPRFLSTTSCALWAALSVTTLRPRPLVCTEDAVASTDDFFAGFFFDCTLSPSNSFASSSAASASARSSSSSSRAARAFFCPFESIPEGT